MKELLDQKKIAKGRLDKLSKMNAVCGKCYSGSYNSLKRFLQIWRRILLLAPLIWSLLYLSIYFDMKIWY